MESPKLYTFSTRFTCYKEDLDCPIARTCYKCNMIVLAENYADAEQIITTYSRIEGYDEVWINNIKLLRRDMVFGSDWEQTIYMVTSKFYMGKKVFGKCEWYVQTDDVENWMKVNCNDPEFTFEYKEEKFDGLLKRGYGIMKDFI